MIYFYTIPNVTCMTKYIVWHQRVNYAKDQSKILKEVSFKLNTIKVKAASKWHQFCKL